MRDVILHEAAGGLRIGARIENETGNLVRLACQNPNGVQAVLQVWYNGRRRAFRVPSGTRTWVPDMIIKMDGTVPIATSLRTRTQEVLE